MLNRFCHFLVLGIWLSALMIGIPHPVWARDLSRQTPQEKVIELGTADNQLVFVPRNCLFATAASTVSA